MFGITLIPSPTATYYGPEPVVLTIDQQIHANSLKFGLDEALVRKIINCEGKIYGNATGRNLDQYGNVWSTDHGPLQVNDYYHKATMDKMGLDIYNESDSLYYGMKMMSEQGTVPWKASRYCWDK